MSKRICAGCGKDLSEVHQFNFLYNHFWCMECEKNQEYAKEKYIFDDRFPEITLPENYSEMYVETGDYYNIDEKINDEELKSREEV